MLAVLLWVWRPSMRWGATAMTSKACCRRRWPRRLPSTTACRRATGMPTGVPSMASAIRRWRRSPAERRAPGAGLALPDRRSARSGRPGRDHLRGHSAEGRRQPLPVHAAQPGDRPDAETGEERWRFDPKVPHSVNRQHLTCRGLSYHAAPASSQAQSCRQRLFMPTADARLIALDARTGEICPGFGDNGEVDLWANMPHVKEGFYYSTSPPVVARDRVIIGGAVNDNVRANEPSGVIRAYDVYTGKLLWNWDPGNPDETAPIAAGQTYTAPAARTAGAFPARTRRWGWSTFRSATGAGSVGRAAQREQRAFFLFHRGARPDSGQLRWVFQTVRHDLWDMDVPAQPSLIDIQTEEGRCRRWWRRPSRATSMCWTAAPASRSCRCGRCPRHKVRPKATGSPDATCVGTVLRTAEAAGQGPLGCHADRPDDVPYPVPFAALRGTLHATLHSGHAGSSVTSASSTGVGWRSIRYARWYSAHRRTWPSLRG